MEFSFPQLSVKVWKYLGIMHNLDGDGGKHFIILKRSTGQVRKRQLNYFVSPFVFFLKLQVKVVVCTCLAGKKMSPKNSCKPLIKCIYSVHILEDATYIQ